LAVNHDQGNVGQAHMPDPRRLELALHQIQDNLYARPLAHGHSCQPSPSWLDVAMWQVQGDVGLANMPDPRCLDFVARQVHGDMGLR
jgi:hypothetical protein